jgi:hypothetical protein
VTMFRMNGACQIPSIKLTTKSIHEILLEN